VMCAKQVKFFWQMVQDKDMVLTTDKCHIDWHH